MGAPHLPTTLKQDERAVIERDADNLIRTLNCTFLRSPNTCTPRISSVRVPVVLLPLCQDWPRIDTQRGLL
jgi:hypothetical protein